MRPSRRAIVSKIEFAGRKADGFVDLFETVDIDADDGRPDLRVGLRKLQRGVEPVEEQFAVRQAGQIVVARRRAEAASAPSSAR